MVNQAILLRLLGVEVSVPPNILPYHICWLASVLDKGVHVPLQSTRSLVKSTRRKDICHCLHCIAKSMVVQDAQSTVAYCGAPQL